MDDKLSDLIGLIYEAALDGGLWPNVLAGLADTAGAHIPMMGAYDLATHRASMLAPRMDPSQLRLLAHWGREPAFRSLGARIVGRAASQPGEVFDLRSVVPADEYVRTDFYNEWWRVQGMGSAGLIAGLLFDGATVFNFGLHKGWPHHHDAFTREEIERTGIAVSHMGRAIRLQRQLHLCDLRDAAGAVADGRDRGVVLLDEAARVLFANRTAEALMAACDGLCLESGRLSVRGGGDLLDSLVAACAGRGEAAHGPGGTLLARRGDGRPPLQLLVAPLRMHGAVAEIPWLGLRRPVAIVTISDPEADDARCMRVLQRRFGLTAAEAAFAIEIGRGGGRHAAAARRGISLSTARTHLGNVFAKTGTHRQADLVRLLFECRSSDWCDDGA
jgi:DNA-binding CsgD family transcriptional regulator